MVYDKEKDDAPFVPEDHLRPPSRASTFSKRNISLHLAKSVNSPNQKFNPVACWKLSHQRINAFAFSPDRQHLAVISEDGGLQVIDYLNEEYALYTSFVVSRFTRFTHLLLGSWISIRVIIAA